MDLAGFGRLSCCSPWAIDDSSPAKCVIAADSTVVSLDAMFEAPEDSNPCPPLFITFALPAAATVNKCSLISNARFIEVYTPTETAPGGPGGVYVKTSQGIPHEGNHELFAHSLVLQLKGSFVMKMVSIKPPASTVCLLVGMEIDIATSATNTPSAPADLVAGSARSLDTRAPNSAPAGTPTSAPQAWPQAGPQGGPLADMLIQAQAQLLTQMSALLDAKLEPVLERLSVIERKVDDMWRDKFGE